MELWRQCAHWLIQCRVLPPNHRVMWDTAQVCDLAQALRDGVLLCQLLNNLLPHAVNLKEINLRPQMSQFLCLKNIRTFLSTCCDRFGLRKGELFEAFDLFDVRDFGKVIDTLSILSYTAAAQEKGIVPFPTEDSLADEDIYSGLSDQIDDTVEEDDELYDCVDMEEDEGDEIYEDLMKSEAPPVQPKTEVDKRSCCLQEIQQTEEKYTDTLESIHQYFMKPLQRFLKTPDMESIFLNVEDLLNVHRYFCDELKKSIVSNNSQNLYQVFLKYKERFLLYGRYCSQVEFATKHLDMTANAREDVQMKLEECSKRANNGRFSLRDLLMVPMQRVLKYHLLLHELVKYTTDAAEKENLKLALDAMRDLAQCVNEVKRDNETLRQITNFQLSIENLNESLAHYGRPKTDGELKITSVEKRSKMDRYAFLLDKALLLCKRKGETFEMKDFINLQSYQIRDDSASERDNRKWCHMFLLIESHGIQGYELFFKTRDLKKKWMEQFEMALSNIYPENATANGHDFQMHSFEETASCKSCQMLLRGVFFQGYRCTRCKSPAHKECLGRVSACGRQDCASSTVKRKRAIGGSSQNKNQSGLTKMEVCEDYYGVPPPPLGFGLPLKMHQGDILELTSADAEQLWWEGRNIVNGDAGWFPCSKVKPFVSVPPSDLSVYPWYSGPMERKEAEVTLNSRSDGTYLVRQRVKDADEFAVSIKFHAEIKHIKVTTMDGLYRITDKKAFRSLIELVEFYKQNSLKDCFKSLDTPLQCPYKEPERTTPRQAEGKIRYFGSAMARYDFCARDRTELTLKEGDIVKILNKKGHQGWWRGEIYGKVGWFPANYVEEDYSEYC
ncbi:proto-oncogene vav [Ambystoma mexicanum]|uniref:proto-oncogene vav n=1 Tax=Ambystoma mexicanum TaxID=8296 RepID=UPI0037E74709